jgi:hypothetical protein
VVCALYLLSLHFINTVWTGAKCFSWSMSVGHLVETLFCCHNFLLELH